MTGKHLWLSALLSFNSWRSCKMVNVMRVPKISFHINWNQQRKKERDGVRKRKRERKTNEIKQIKFEVNAILWKRRSIWSLLLSVKPFVLVPKILLFNIRFMSLKINHITYKNSRGRVAYDIAWNIFITQTYALFINPSFTQKYAYKISRKNC